MTTRGCVEVAGVERSIVREEVSEDVHWEVSEDVHCLAS